jgi:hypothetical protein
MVFIPGIGQKKKARPLAGLPDWQTCGMPETGLFALGLFGGRGFSFSSSRFGFRGLCSLGSSGCLCSILGGKLSCQRLGGGDLFSLARGLGLQRGPTRGGRARVCGGSC